MPMPLNSHSEWSTSSWEALRSELLSRRVSRRRIERDRLVASEAFRTIEGVHHEAHQERSQTEPPK